MIWKTNNSLLKILISCKVEAFGLPNHYDWEECYNPLFLTTIFTDSNMEQFVKQEGKFCLFERSLKGLQANDPHEIQPLKQ